jgi:hypothetical protein
MINIPGGCLREPYARLHHEGAIVSARNFYSASWPARTSLALRISFSMRCCIPTSDTALLSQIYSFAVLEHPCSRWYSKEVIRLQVPLQPPCYDFSPLAELRFDHYNMK